MQRTTLYRSMHPGLSKSSRTDLYLRTSWMLQASIRTRRMFSRKLATLIRKVNSWGSLLIYRKFLITLKIWLKLSKITLLKMFKTGLRKIWLISFYIVKSLKVQTSSRDQFRNLMAIRTHRKQKIHYKPTQMFLSMFQQTKIMTSFMTEVSLGSKLYPNSQNFALECSPAITWLLSPKWCPTRCLSLFKWEGTSQKDLTSCMITTLIKKDCSLISNNNARVWTPLIRDLIKAWRYLRRVLS